MNVSARRFLQLFAFLTAWTLVIVMRLVQVQIVRHADYTTRAVRQQERTLSLSPVRGSIVDVRGRVLAESESAGSVYADPQAVTDRTAAARALAAAGVGTAHDLSARLVSDAGFVWLARQLPLTTTERVRQLHLPGIYLLEEHRRSYPRGSLAANVVGYVGVDGEGLCGIEHSFDAFVRGREGKVTILQDAKRHAYLVGGNGANRPVDGNQVVLTLDAVVQFITERALARQVERYHAASGSAIVMDVRDGSILAMASLPTFDPNSYRNVPPAAWRNRAVQDIYEPGSTFKIVTASAGLEEGVVTPSQVLDCTGGAIQIGNATIHEHGGNQYGLITFEEVMVHSSNVGAARVGLGLGPSRFYEYIRRFGFGERTGIQLPGESSGLVRRTDKWSQLSNAEIAIGQEIGVTPVQLMRALGTVANGGIRIEPRIVDRVVDSSGAVVYRPQRPAPVRVISEKTAAVLNEILKAVVARGTGVNAGLFDHIVAGKTGTAQKAALHGYSPDKVVASFAGYVPADRPRLAILVVVDEPHGGQYGGTVAAPAFHDIAEATLRYLGVPPTIPARTIEPAAPLLAGFSQPKMPRSEAGTIPDFRGLDVRAAIAGATAAGLIVETTGSGVVEQQQPLPGAILNPGATLHLSFSPPVARAERVIPRMKPRGVGIAEVGR